MPGIKAIIMVNYNNVIEIELSFTPTTQIYLALYLTT